MPRRRSRDSADLDAPSARRLSGPGVFSSMGRTSGFVINWPVTFDVEDGRRFAVALVQAAYGSELRMRPDGAAWRVIGGSYGEQTTGAVAHNAVRLFVPLNTFLQIVDAASISGQLGDAPFQIKDDAHEALRDLASRMAP
jgi:hypothetical protein